MSPGTAEAGLPGLGLPPHLAPVDAFTSDEPFAATYSEFIREDARRHPLARQLSFGGHHPAEYIAARSYQSFGTYWRQYGGGGAFVPRPPTFVEGSFMDGCVGAAGAAGAAKCSQTYAKRKHVCINVCKMHRHPSTLSVFRQSRHQQIVVL